MIDDRVTISKERYEELVAAEGRSRAPLSPGIPAWSREYEMLKSDAEKWRSYSENHAFVPTTQLQKDAYLGSLVRKMNCKLSLSQYYNVQGEAGWQCGVYAADTPEEALLAALKGTE